MDDYVRFHSWLFPGDPQVFPNGPELPQDVEAALDEVSQGTGIRKNWLRTSARAVLDGVAGLGCLGYLHGASGQFVSEGERYPDVHEDSFKKALKRETSRREKQLQARDPKNDNFVEAQPYWSLGYVDFFYYRTADEYNSRTPTRTRREKVGRLLKKLPELSSMVRSELLHEFETRELPSWDWKITTHPFDILTMSFGRPWEKTSCMRPGGVAEFGPLTDMAAGSACLFFYRPGADSPAGRTILRPILRKVEGGGLQPAIASGRTVYGAGPDGLTPETIQAGLAEATGYELEVSEPDICSLGERGLALVRAVYSDVDPGHCHQSQDQYDRAYDNLGRAAWPPPALDVGDLRDRAGALAQLVEKREFCPLSSYAVTAADAWADNLDFYNRTRGLISLCEPSDGIPSWDEIEEAVETTGLSEDVVHRDLGALMRERFGELLEEHLSGIGTYVTVVRRLEDEDENEDLISDLYGERDFSSEGFVGDEFDPKKEYLPDVIQKKLDELGIEEEDILVVFAVPDDCYLTEMEEVIKRNDALLVEFKLPEGAYDWSDLVP